MLNFSNDCKKRLSCLFINVTFPFPPLFSPTLLDKGYVAAVTFGSQSTAMRKLPLLFKCPQCRYREGERRVHGAKRRGRNAVKSPRSQGPSRRRAKGARSEAKGTRRGVEPKIPRTFAKGSEGCVSPRAYGAPHPIRPGRLKGLTLKVASAGVSVRTKPVHTRGPTLM